MQEQKHSMLPGQLHQPGRLSYAALLSCLSVWLLLACSAQAQLPIYDYKVVNTYPHNVRSFTQGLLIHEGAMYEGTGLYGQSALLQTNLEDGSIIRSRELNARYFGEGIAVANGLIYQLTWRENMVFVYDLETFDSVTSHFVPTEGWGLTWDGEHLILSDGSDRLYFVDPQTFATVRSITVSAQGQAIWNLNELEYINGEIWANVWMTEQLVRIDPTSGEVKSIVDLTGLRQLTQVGGSDAVLNGIAWNEDTEQLFVTGKLWADLFEIELIPREPAAVDP